jgi:cyclophilin family peptidyl-prolyl cis-trans isomerase
VPTDKRLRQREGRQARQDELRRAQQKSQLLRRYLIIGAVVVILGVAFYFLTRNNGGKKKSNVATSSSTSAPSTSAAAGGGPPKAKPVATGEKLSGWSCPKPDGSSPRTSQFPNTPPPMCIDPAKTYTAHLATSEGQVDFTLDTKKTPNTANNFAVLSLYHYYDGTSIDRIDTSIDILQSGSPNTQDITDPGPGYNIKDEGTGFKYADGDMVMARGSAANSGSAQYFFVVGAKASALNSQGTYVTFGHVTTGLDVLHKVESLYQACNPSDQSCLGGAPSRVVTITKVTITES